MKMPVINENMKILMKNKAFFLVLLLVLLVPAVGYCQTTAAAAKDFNETVGKVACAIANVVSGNIAKAIATIGIVFLGAKAFIGKLDWATVLIASLGVFIVFGMVPLVSTITSFGGEQITTLCPKTP
jgi:type IV secretory pathway VirB2 component (pilin)